MQEEFLYLDSETHNLEQYFWKLPLMIFGLSIFFVVSLLSLSLAVDFVFYLSFILSCVFILLGYFCGKEFWISRIKKSEGYDPEHYSEMPKRREAYESLMLVARADPFACLPVNIGFSQKSGNGLWLEDDSLHMGLSIFSKDDSSHLNFSLSLLLQHLLGPGARPVVIIDLRTNNNSLPYIQKLSSLSGRSDDFIESHLDLASICFNPLDQTHSTEIKAKNLILIANLLMNNSTAGLSLGAETEDFFFRIARCLDSYNKNWNVRHLSEFLYDFKLVSSQLAAYFEVNKDNQAILDLSQIEKYLLQDSAADSVQLRKLIKILSIGLTDHLRNPRRVTKNSTDSLSEFLSQGKILYFNAQSAANRSEVNLACCLLAEELKTAIQKYDKLLKSSATAQILIIADQQNRIPNLEVYCEIAKFEKANVIFSGGDWKAEVEQQHKEYSEKKSNQIINSTYFNFQISEYGQLFTEQGNVPRFLPLKVKLNP